MSPSKLAEKKPQELLPHGGKAQYFGPILPKLGADSCFNQLVCGVSWEKDEGILFSKKWQTKRKTAWYGDRPFRYTYSKKTKVALPWLPMLLEMKKLAEEKSGHFYNACLLNLYHQGEEGMGWHSDAEKELQQKAAIASLSFGAERRFLFKHKRTKEKISQVLEHGSLLVMKDDIQENWLHCLPPSKRVEGFRINLTFRLMAPEG